MAKFNSKYDLHKAANDDEINVFFKESTFTGIYSSSLPGDLKDKFCGQITNVGTRFRPGSMQWSHSKERYGKAISNRITTFVIPFRTQSPPIGRAPLRGEIDLTRAYPCPSKGYHYTVSMAQKAVDPT